MIDLLEVEKALSGEDSALRQPAGIERQKTFRGFWVFNKMH